MSIVKGKFALITGGLGGIGIEIIKELLKNEIAGISVLDLINSEKENLLQDLAKNYGKTILFIPTDITNESQVNAAFEKTFAVLKNLDIVFNVAGILNENKWELCLNTNLIAPIHVSNIAIEKYFSKNHNEKEAIIINFTALAAFTPFSTCPIYCASKYGLLGYSLSLAQQCTTRNINVRILNICPGFTSTPLIQVGMDKKLKTDKDFEIYNQIFKMMPSQEPNYVSKAVIDIMAKGQTGSGWVIENNEQYEIEFKSYSELKKKN